MHTAASYIQHSHGYPSFLSYARNPYYLNDSNSTHFSSYPNNIKDDDDDQNQPLSPTLTESSNAESTSFKKRSRAIPTEEKDVVYYEKRARNNESAKRSRDGRRMKEQQIQDRVQFLQNENLRLSMENQAIQYQLSQLHALCGGGGAEVSKGLQ